MLNDSLKEIKCHGQHTLFNCLITLCLSSSCFLCLYYRLWEISFLMLHCWIKNGFICSCKFCGAPYLIWELQTDRNFRIFAYSIASNKSKAVGNTHENHTEEVHMRECKQQANFRCQRHKAFPTCHKYKTTWSWNEK